MERLARSFLFVPGDRSDRFDKAVASGAHETVIDLEDAVAPGAKAEARQATADWLAVGIPAGVRINGADTSWFDDDLEMMKQHRSAWVMLPKADEEAVSRAVAALPGRPLIPLIETVRGYMELPRVAASEGVKRIAFGSVDFGVETGIEDEGDGMTAIRTRIVLESCYAGLLPPVDGVSVNFRDDELMKKDALRSRQLGFGGKLCIHPKQVAAVNDTYLPSAEQVEWAERVVQAFEQSRGGATTVDGKMIDKPVVVQAERILAEVSR